jgi:glycogen debranching enzyme
VVDATTLPLRWIALCWFFGDGGDMFGRGSAPERVAANGVAGVRASAVARFRGYSYLRGDRVFVERWKFMAQDTDETRNFTLRESGDETSVFSGRYPRQAALKAARELEPAASEQEAAREEIVLREKGTEKTHIYEGWAWEADAPEDKPDWMPERITEANVSKQGINHLEEI